MRSYFYLKQVNYLSTFVLCFFLLGALLLRPSMFGQEYTVYGLIVIFVAVVIRVFALDDKNGLSSKRTESLAYLTLLIVIFWIYCLTISLVVGDSRQDYLFKCIAAGIGVPIAAFIFFLNGGIYVRFYRYFAVLNSLLGYSIAITFILLQFLPADALRIGSFEIKGYLETEGNGDILFPFSPMYALLSEYNIYRFLAVYREAGIAQLFFCWSFLYFVLKRDSYYFIAGAFLGGALCGSTTFFVSVSLALLFYLISRKQRSMGGYLILLIGAVAMAAAVVFLPGIGLLDKLQSHAESLDDRLFAISFAFDDVLGLIFGRGLYYIFSPYEGIGINAVSFIYYYGLIGFSLYISLYFMMAFLRRGNFVNYFLLLLPLLFTSLLFQPLVDAPLAFLLFYYIPWFDVEA